MSTNIGVSGRIECSLIVRGPCPSGCIFTVKDASKIQDELRVRVRVGSIRWTSSKERRPEWSTASDDCSSIYASVVIYERSPIIENFAFNLHSQPDLLLSRIYNHSVYELNVQVQAV